MIPKSPSDFPHEKGSPRILLSVFLSFFRIGCFAFGGGYAILPLYEAELMERRKWVEHEEILDVYAVGQSVPGVIAANTAVLLGYRIAGRLGALAAVFGVNLPAFLVILLVAGILPQFKDSAVVAGALRGIRPAVAALVLRAAIKIGRRSLLDVVTWGIAVLTIVLMLATTLHPVWLIFLSGMAGFVLYLTCEKAVRRVLRLEEKEGG